MNSDGDFRIGLWTGQASRGLAFGSAGWNDPAYLNGIKIGLAEQTVGVLEAIREGQSEHIQALSHYLESLISVVYQGNEAIIGRLNVIIDQLDEQTRMERAKNGLTDLDAYLPQMFAPGDDWFASMTGDELAEQATAYRCVALSLVPLYKFIGRFPTMAPAYRVLDGIASRCEAHLRDRAVDFLPAAEALNEAIRPLADTLVKDGFPPVLLPWVFDFHDAEYEGSFDSRSVKFTRTWHFNSHEPVGLYGYLVGLSGNRAPVMSIKGADIKDAGSIFRFGNDARDGLLRDLRRAVSDHAVILKKHLRAPLADRKKIDLTNLEAGANKLVLLATEGGEWKRLICNALDYVQLELT
ncbi:hypothetical protein RKE25_22785 (plasmid) [Dyella sp. BiH032]|uniref:hypothetical protein n=1 Tax=Dyella sp. BiH032 TaxID=3075430 RepID=UPI00289379BB|nr:hypothetical protein [Dyella sp. BiH032]WNL48362.1 hypothetical protein RKE25_22785 [Dyella sp. BiH032]